MVIKSIGLVLCASVFIVSTSARGLTGDEGDGKPENAAAEGAPSPPQPKFEFGLGATGIYLNDYPGSDQQHFRWLPIPYIVYRGEYFRSDGQGKVRGMFLNSAEIDVDASIDGSFPVDDSENRARDGMPSLDWMGEIGPRALIHVYSGHVFGVDLSLPVRWVFSTDASTRLDDRGWDFNPEFKFHRRSPFDAHGSFHGVVGSLWGTSQLTRYFYEVEPQYVTVDRAEYAAKPGYMYTYLGLTYFHNSSLFDHVMYFIGVNKFYLSGSSNRESPLMRSLENESYFVGAVYNFFRSKELEKSVAAKPQ